MSANKFGCAMTYFGLSLNQNGTLSPCCQYEHFNRETRQYIDRILFDDHQRYVDTISRRMHDDALNNIRHEGCVKCWQEEDLGARSLRLWLNERFPYDPKTIDVSVDHPIKHLEVRFGNICNLKCIMCFPKNSSSVAHEQSKHEEAFKSIGIYNPIPKTPNFWESPKFPLFQEKIFKHAESVNISGGEPIIVPEFIGVLEYIGKNNPDVKVSISTNLSILTDDIFDKLSKIKNLWMNISVEGIGVMNDYLRYPSTWDALLENIRKIQSIPNVGITLCHTFQHTSVYAIPDLMKFVNENKMFLHLNPVQGMDRLKLSSVPPSQIEKFREWAVKSDSIPTEHRAFILNSIEDAVFNQSHHTDFMNYVHLLDSIRGTSFEETFGLDKEEIV